MWLLVCSGSPTVLFSLDYWVLNIVPLMSVHILWAHISLGSQKSKRDRKGQHFLQTLILTQNSCRIKDSAPALGPQTELMLWQQELTTTLLWDNHSRDRRQVPPSQVGFVLRSCQHKNLEIPKFQWQFQRKYNLVTTASCSVPACLAKHQYQTTCNPSSSHLPYHLNFRCSVKVIQSGKSNLLTKLWPCLCSEHNR